MFVGRNKITILDKAQQEGMRKACRLGREVLDIAAREVRAGVTTDYIDEVVHKATVERNVSIPTATDRLYSLPCPPIQLIKSTEHSMLT